MAETQQSVAALLANLADNKAGDVSAEDVRDVLVSAMSVRGELWSHDVIAGSQTFDNLGFNKINNWENVGENTGMTPNTATDDITVDIDGDYYVEVTLNIISSPTDTITFQVFFDGVGQDNLVATEVFLAASEFTEISISGIIQGAVATKKIDVRAKTVAGVVAARLEDGNFSAWLIG